MNADTETDESPTEEAAMAPEGPEAPIRAKRASRHAAATMDADEAASETTQSEMTEADTAEAEAAGGAMSDDAAEEPRLPPLTTEPIQQDLPNLDDIRADELIDPIEAIIFAAGEPVTLSDIKRVLERAWAEEHEAVRNRKLSLAKDALNQLKERWAALGGARGFGLIEVADGLTFRSNPRYAGYLRATREERPVRISRPALETLAIIAYRQPATKPEIDHIRGVDCGGTIRLLLDRNLVRIVGKRDEPGRPMLYGTTREFLSFFNLSSLQQLPSLREFSELNEESQEELNQTFGPSLDDLSRNAKKLRLDEEPAIAELDQAVVGLDATETKTRDAFASQGISIDPAVAGAEGVPAPEQETNN